MSKLCDGDFAGIGQLNRMARQCQPSFFVYGTFSALPQRRIVPAWGGLDLLYLRLFLPQIGLDRLPGEVEPVGPEADAAGRVGEGSDCQTRSCTNWCEKSFWNSSGRRNRLKDG